MTGRPDDEYGRRLVVLSSCRPVVNSPSPGPNVEKHPDFYHSISALVNSYAWRAAVGLSGFCSNSIDSQPS
jgi:hypothetical protein